MNKGIFSILPIEGVFVIVLLVTFSSVLAGFTLGRRFRDRKSDNDAPPIGSVIGALFALLAFMLALTFSSASGRYDTRKQLLLDEVNAIGTAFLRTSFLEEEDKQQSQALIKRYVQIRVNALNQKESLTKRISDSESIQKELWRIATNYPKGDVNGAITMSYASALNEVFDYHTSRIVVAVTYRVHSSIWGVLLTVSVLSMAALGFQFAYSGGRRVWLCLLLATTFSLVLLLIEDLDRPGQGTIQVSQRPMFMLLESITEESK